MEPVGYKMERLDQRRINEPLKIRWTLSGGDLAINPSNGMKLQSVMYAFDLRTASGKASNTTSRCPFPTRS